MVRYATFLAIAVLAGCGEASQSDGLVGKQVNAAPPLPLPNDQALVKMFDIEAHAMSAQTRAEGGNAEVETYTVVRNSKCSELAPVGDAIRRIGCEFESTIEFSPILADDAQLRSITADNSREWTKRNLVLQQDGKNWKLDPPPIPIDR